MVTKRESKSGVEPRAEGKRRANGQGPTLRAQGMRTYSTLVDAARKLLLAEGPLALTLRRVAEDAGVRISNVQYYFPSRAELFRAVMKTMLDAYVMRIEEAKRNSLTPEAAIAVLESLFDRVVHDARAEEAALISHFWSIGVTDEESARVLRDAYDSLILGTAELIHRGYPTIPAAESRRLASVLVVLSDGLFVQLGMAKRDDASMRDIAMRVRESGHLLLAQAAAASMAS